MKKIHWGKLILFIGICQLAGIIGAFFTTPAIPTWYASLIKPTWNPPSWVFGPVWTFLYACIGTSAYLVWHKGMENPKVRDALVWFGIHLFFNMLWSIIFFGIQNIYGAFLEIIVLWMLIVIVIKKFYRLEKNASYLLIPYLLWVTFASYLNFTIWLLNS